MCGLAGIPVCYDFQKKWFRAVDLRCETSCISRGAFPLRCRFLLYARFSFSSSPEKVFPFLAKIKWYGKSPITTHSLLNHVLHGPQAPPQTVQPIEASIVHKDRNWERYLEPNDGKTHIIQHSQQTKTLPEASVSDCKSTLKHPIKRIHLARKFCPPLSASKKPTLLITIALAKYLQRHTTRNSNPVIPASDLVRYGTKKHAA